MSTRAETTRFFDGVARRYDRAYAPDTTTSRRRLARLLGALPAEARVLDLGVGTGRELSALLDAGHRPTGLDVSKEMLAICGRRARPVPLVEADLWGALPFDDGTFDAAIALHGTLAHPPDEGALARLPHELARVLSTRGVLVAEAPSPAWIDGLGAAEVATGEMRLRRVASDRCLHEDLIAGVSIEARALTPDHWRALFADWAAVTVEPGEPGELFIVARRSLR